jgi:hypothetical protein
VLEAVETQVEMDPGISGVVRGEEQRTGHGRRVEAGDDTQSGARGGREETEVVAVGQCGVVMGGGEAERQSVAVGEQAVARCLADRTGQGHVEEQQAVPAGQGT